MKNYLEFFTDSMSRAFGDERQHLDFMTRFYELFIESSPDVARRFAATDMARQKEMLARSIREMLDFSTSRAASEHLRQAAERHNRAHRDIPPALYDLWMDCLLATVREFDTGFNDEVELSWRVVLAPGVAYMKFKYDRT